MWTRKHDPRHGSIVVDEAIAIQRVLRGELCAIGRHVDELVPVGHIARRVDAGFRGAHVVIDHDGAASVLRHTGLRQAEGCGIGDASRRDQQPLRLQLDRLAAFADADGDAGLIFTAGIVGDAAMKRDAFGAEGRSQRVRHFRFHLRQQARPADHRHLNAHARHHLGKLHADIPAADDNQAPGQRLQFQQCRAGQVGHGLDAGNRRHGRSSARSDDDIVGGDRAVFDEHAGAVQPRRALQIGNPVILGQQVGVFLLP